MGSAQQIKDQMRVAVVCGDGLPISGLLTTLRNVVDLIPATKGCPDIIRNPIPTDLGYSWRPDKSQFFPYGPRTTAYPTWMQVSKEVPVIYKGLADDLTSIRRKVAYVGGLTLEDQNDLRQRIDHIALPYERYFSKWFEDHEVDWVIAINMTLSDAVPVTQALHQAGASRWGGGRAGGIVFWDHDLFGSYAVAENNERVYPVMPNPFTPIPQKCSWQVWALASPVLAQETKQYPTLLKPLVVPLVLPDISHLRHGTSNQSLIRDFLLEQNLLTQVMEGDRVVLCPVRIFPVKGVDISIRLLAAVNSLCDQNGEKKSHLLIFGDLDEDKAYAARICQVIAEEGVADKVVFLGGVPLVTTRINGRVQLDEKDLLRLCTATGGGVFYTPSVPNVESVGLGPALAAIAGVPCVVSDFAAFDIIYGKDFQAAKTGTNTLGEIEGAAQDFFDAIVAISRHANDRGRSRHARSVALISNSNIVADRFPTGQWKELLETLASRAMIDTNVLLQLRQAFEKSGRKELDVNSEGESLTDLLKL